MCLYLYDYHLYGRQSACNYWLFTDISVNAVYIKGHYNVIIDNMGHLYDYHLYEWSSACDYWYTGASVCQEISMYLSYFFLLLLFFFHHSKIILIVFF